MIEVGFVNRFYALARFFVTFLGVFTAFAAPRALELAVAFRSGFLARLEAGFPTFRAALAPLPAALAPPAADFVAFRDPGGRPVRLAAARFLDALAHTPWWGHPPSLPVGGKRTGIKPFSAPG